MKVNYGFQSTMTAKAGMGDQLVKLLLTGLDEGNLASTSYCLVYIVSRSASNPDVVHVSEGWSTEDDHRRILAGDAAQAMLAQIAALLAGEPVYTDYTPVNGKANL